MRHHLSTIVLDAPTRAGWSISIAKIILDCSDDPQTKPTIYLDSLIRLYSLIPRTDHSRCVVARTARLIYINDKIKFCHFMDGSRKNSDISYYDHNKLDRRGKGPTTKTKFINEAETIKDTKELFKKLFSIKTT